MNKFTERMIVLLFISLNAVGVYAALSDQWTTVNILISIYGTLLLALAISTWQNVKVVGIIELTKEKEEK